MMRFLILIWVILENNLGLILFLGFHGLGRSWEVTVEHIEKVKWYAPRIRHLVADVKCRC